MYTIHGNFAENCMFYVNQIYFFRGFIHLKHRFFLWSNQRSKSTFYLLRLKTQPLRKFPPLFHSLTLVLFYHKVTIYRAAKPSRLFWVEYFEVTFTMVGHVRRSLLEKRGGNISYLCRQNFIALLCLDSNQHPSDDDGPIFLFPMYYCSIFHCPIFLFPIFRK